MKIETILYTKKNGWSQKEFPQMDSPKTLIFIFGSPLYLKDSSPIEELIKTYPQSHFVGCSSAGEIYGKQVLDESLSVAIVRFTETSLKIVSAPIQMAEDSLSIGEGLAKELSGEGLAGVMVFSDGLKVNGSQLVKGMNSHLAQSVILIGGLAGDGPDFKETWVIQNKKPVSSHVTAVGFYGNKIKIGHASKGGWDIFGPERKVTKSKSNILYEIDGKPALKLYKEYLGEKASDLPASGLLFPLQIRTSRNDEKRLVRTILSVDEEKQAVIFAGDIPEGSLTQLMRANFDRLIEGASEAASNIGNMPSPTLVIAISCVGRRLVLGERIEEETEATLENLPQDVKQVGFYSYGEISPYVKGSACELHNQTMTLTAISEES